MAHTALLVCLVSTVSGHSKKGGSSRHTTKLEQSISLDIYGMTLLAYLPWPPCLMQHKIKKHPICDALSKVAKASNVV